MFSEMLNMAHCRREIKNTNKRRLSARFQKKHINKAQQTNPPGVFIQMGQNGTPTRDINNKTSGGCFARRQKEDTANQKQTESHMVYYFKRVNMASRRVSVGALNNNRRLCCSPSKGRNQLI